MHETPVIDAPIVAIQPGESPDAALEKDWEQFDACTRCHGHAPIDERNDGELTCQLCGAKLPRPSS
ncbi:MAG TPA: hypothetical protein VGK87_15210 [Anaerolineae bacterium]